MCIYLGNLRITLSFLLSYPPTQKRGLVSAGTINGAVHDTQLFVEHNRPLVDKSDFTKHSPASVGFVRASRNFAAHS